MSLRTGILLLALSTWFVAVVWTAVRDHLERRRDRKLWEAMLAETEEEE